MLPLLEEAPQRGVRKDQWRAPLYVACGGSRRRSPGKLSVEEAGQICGFGIPQEGSEASWEGREDRHGRPLLLTRRGAGTGQRGAAGDGQAPQQPGRELTLAIPTTRVSDETISSHEVAAATLPGSCQSA